LDGEGMLDPLFAECSDYFVADAEIGKGGFGCGS